MKKKMKIGLLGLYIKLYDDLFPERRAAFEEFLESIAAEYEARGLEVVRCPVARIKPEFEEAVRRFETEGAEAIVTLHLAYSPSLESIDALAATRLPLVVLDTTPDAEFGYDDIGKLMMNHGIHGVQDMCNLLIRRDRAFLICAGHWRESDVLDRSVEALKAAVMAHKISTVRVGSIGGEFKGMGDFQAPPGTFGMTVVPFREAGPVDEDEIAAETALDKERFIHGAYSPDAYRRTLVESLKLRHWVEHENLDAFTICFPGVERGAGWRTVPFLEASKAMARGIGYAGEGDVLTAALTAALNRVFNQVSFGEMFCPDWTGNRIFLSHMGELNIALTHGKPLLYESNYRFSDTHAPVQATGCFKAGSAWLVDLAPLACGFRLIASPVELEAPSRPSQEGNQGWFTPPLGVADFLAEYSRLGGTHHLAVAYDAEPGLLRDFAHLMGWDFRIIG